MADVETVELNPDIIIVLYCLGTGVGSSRNNCV